jgi:hypothetical protein
MPGWFRVALLLSVLVISVLMSYFKSGPVALVLAILMVLLAVVAVVIGLREGRASGADGSASLNLHR